ncbi:ParA family protein [Burkholderia gladioli]|uniref:ParA family protein n=1 Tax=Burkholderia gladioli TaxID=28095 RepID=UPI001C5E0E12|nr:ParA family protein [Burkholderia gladioli]MBW5284094.1 ParA family protein [Burkholderia gladioli]
MKIVVVTNGKGGVSKTTTAVHLAHYLAQMGYRTALMDADEGDISEVFTTDEATPSAPYLKTGDVFRGNPQRLAPRLAAENLWLIEADSDLIDLHDLPMDLLAALEAEIESDSASIAKIRDLFGAIQSRLTLPFEETLHGMSADFDVCVIDTPPHLARRTLAVLCAADAVITPTNISVFTMARIAKLQQTLDAIRRDYNPKMKHLGFLLAKVNSKSPNEMEGVQAMREAYGDLVLQNMVIDRTSVSTALALGRPVWQSASAGAQRAAAREMRAACQEVVDRLGIQPPAQVAA